MVLNFLKSGYNKVKAALSKTRAVLGHRIRELFLGQIDEGTLDTLEQLLFEADLGTETARDLTHKVRQAYRADPRLTGDDLLQMIKAELLTQLKKTPPTLQQVANGPLVVLIVGVNGNGKTTSVAKIAKRFHSDGKKVLIGAADTFRAAAMEQLETWSKRIGTDIVKGQPNADPAAVTFDTVSAGKARSVDLVIIDTAGRLQNKTHLMQELEKIRRCCHKVIEGAPHETLLVLDATTGQNAVDQAKTFHQYTPITGIILTKLDGTAKGGIVVHIQRQLGIPVKFIGVGEGIDDLEPFDADAFVNALFES